MPNINDNEICNNSNNETFENVVQTRVSRRGFLGSGLAAVAATTGVAALMQSVPGLEGAPGKGKGGASLLGFEGIEPSADDFIHLPEGYTSEVLIRWGDPVSTGVGLAPGNTAADQAQQWGMHNDGLVYFPIKESNRGLLVQNNEYTDDYLLVPGAVSPNPAFPGSGGATMLDPAKWDAAATAKSLAAHGVSIVEVQRTNAPGNGKGLALGHGAPEWEVVRPSAYARRITGNSPIDVAGPAAGHPLLQTAADPTGRRVLGTLNNCAMGFTPWNT
jgi:secreted PhoX family phosphatase